MFSQSEEVISYLQDELAAEGTRRSIEQTAVMEQLSLDLDANKADLQAETEKVSMELNELRSVVAAKGEDISVLSDSFWGNETSDESLSFFLIDDPYYALNEGASC